MLALRVESQPTKVVIIRRLPFKLGRSGDDLEMTGPGIWDGHAELTLLSPRSIQFTCRTETTVMINGVTQRTGHLRLGDVIQVGSHKLRVELPPPTARSFLGWERAVACAGILLIAVELWMALGRLFSLPN